MLVENLSQMENSYQLGDFDIDDKDFRILRNRIDGRLGKQSKRKRKRKRKRRQRKTEKALTEEQLENKLENVAEKVKESVLREKPKFTIPEKLFELLNNGKKDHHFVQCHLMFNWPKATEAFANWENQVHKKWFFHKLKNKEEKEEIEENSWYEENDKKDKHCKRMPWYGKSDWVAPSATKEIEDFIEKARIDLFGNQSKKTKKNEQL